MERRLMTMAVSALAILMVVGMYIIREPAKPAEPVISQAEQNRIEALDREFQNFLDRIKDIELDSTITLEDGSKQLENDSLCSREYIDVKYDKVAPTIITEVHNDFIFYYIGDGLSGMRSIEWEGVSKLRGIPKKITSVNGKVEIHYGKENTIIAYDHAGNKAELTITGEQINTIEG